MWLYKYHALSSENTIEIMRRRIILGAIDLRI